jgi:thioredoxin reductase
VPQLGPQPDFAHLTQGPQQAATELGNFTNLPPFVQGNALMQQMQQFQQQTNQNFTDVRNDIQTVRNEISTSRQAT